MPLGAAILLGGLLAPTDPVLAADVQVEHPGDRDRLRFSLTGEAALNDGSAFPFVMLGLGLLGLHELGAFGWRWLAFDVVWAVRGGLAIGWLLGMLVGRLVLYLRRTHKEAVGLDDFLGLGLIALVLCGRAASAHLRLSGGLRGRAGAAADRDAIHRRAGCRAKTTAPLASAHTRRS